MNFIETTCRDLRFGWRMLRNNRGFSLTAVLSLALGISANTTVWCWIQNILLRPFSGVAKQDQLLVVTTQQGAAVLDSLSLPDLRDQAKLKDVFAGVIGSAALRVELAGNSRSEWIYGQITTANFFAVLGVKPFMGRTFLLEQDDRPGSPPVMVISERLWKRRFAADPEIVGRTVKVNGLDLTIIGVVSEPFHGTMTGFISDFWAPVVACGDFMGRSQGSLANRSDRWLQAQARLRLGVTTTGAQAALDILAAQLQHAYPDSNRETLLHLLPLWRAPYGGQPLMLPVLSLLQVVSLGVLLIVAVNVANLLLARAALREKEVSIRLAMGAGRERLIRQLLTESLLLSVIGGTLGVILAHWMVGLVGFFIPNTYLPLGFSTSLDWRILGSALALTLTTGVLFSLVPALRISRTQVRGSLKEGGRTFTPGSAHHRVLNCFVVSQIGLALVLLVCAGVCLKALSHARHTDLGFDPNHLLYVGFNAEMNGDNEARAIVCRNLRQRIESLPGVQAAALASWYPLGFDPAVSSMWLNVQGYPQNPNEDMNVGFCIAWPGYFEAMRTPLLDGRDFTEQDNEKSAPVAIINEVMAKRFWPGQNPLGRKFKASGTAWTVVGVAKAGKYRSLSEPPRCFFYIPFRQWPYVVLLGLTVRTTASPASMVNVVQEEIHRLNPGIAIWAALPMTDYIQAAFMPQQIASSLLSLLGVIALALAAMGVYGVMAYVVSQRAHEFGVRMALGARKQDILRLVVQRGMILTLLGTTVGGAMALAVMRLLARFLYGVSPFDAQILVIAILLLSLITLLASWLPAQWAITLNPVQALRHE